MPSVDETFPVRRNTFLLASVVAVNSAVLQLVAAMSSLTFVLVSGISGLLGLGPAIFLASAGLTALPAGRMMDRVGRIPVLASGLAVGSVGAAMTAAGARSVSTPLVVLGFVLLGSAAGVMLLARTAGGDMYPPERRAHGISLVLVGAVFGAILGPAFFGPLFAGRERSAEALAVPWLAASGLFLVALALALLVRPDPKKIAEAIAAGLPPEQHVEPAPLRVIVSRPGVIPAMIAALASFAVMVSVMNLTGYVVVDHHHHEQADVFPIIGAHVLGMYALVLVVGNLVDRIGRTPALVGGLFVMGLSCAPLAWADSVLATAVLLFGLGLGWNLSFVAATAQLLDRTAPADRGKLMGLNDLIAQLLGASMALVGGVALDQIGVGALAAGATLLALAPIAWILGRGGAPRPVAET